MKKTLSILAVAFLFMNLSSCEKDAGLLPNISFITTSGYTYQDGIIAVNTPFKVGIAASKSEDKDVLKKFSYSVSKDGGSEIEIENEDIDVSQEDNFSKDINLTSGATAGTEKYTFTIVNRDGLINKISFTLTVN